VSSAPAIVDPRAAWLARRREIVTASDVAAILGEDPRRGALAVWCEKTGAIEQDETLPMWRGRHYEAAIAEDYARQTGRPVGSLPEYEITMHQDLPWLGASLDRKVLATKALPDPFGRWDVVGGITSARAPLQIKMALGFVSSKEWEDEPPTYAQIQVLVEMACAGAEWGALCALVGPGPLATFDLAFDEAAFAAMVPHLERFRWHVEKGIAPEADAKPGTSAAIRKLWALSNGETVPMDTPQDLELVQEWELAKARIKAAQETEEKLQNQIRTRIGAAHFGALNDGSYMRLRPRAGSKGRVLDHWWPRMHRRRG
jgi:putative phage-type endonuclease